jgi:hypothetical protein
MSCLYYLKSENGKKIGPMTEAELSKYNVYGDTIIWREGLQGWVTIAELPEADALLRKLPPPDDKTSDGCGVWFAILVLAIPVAIFVPFVWIIVACAVIYLITKL